MQTNESARIPQITAVTGMDLSEPFTSATATNNDQGFSTAVVKPAKLWADQAPVSVDIDPFAAGRE